MNLKTEKILIKVNQQNFDCNTLEVQTKEFVNSNNTGFIIIDLINRSIYWSIYFLKTLGYNPNDSSSNFENFEEILHPSDKHVVDYIINNQNYSQVLFFKLRFRTVNNTYILLHSYLKTIN